MNGTFLNGTSVEKETLFYGDIISILQEDFEIYRFEC